MRSPMSAVDLKALYAKNPNRNRVILHSDANSFYASCECLYNPDIRDKPVAVCGDPEARHGIVLTKNLIAKKYGIQTGEVIFKARQKCPDLIVVPAHYDLYRKFSRKLRRMYESYTDRVESYGLDECWLDVSGGNMDIEGGARLANEIRERVMDELLIPSGAVVSIWKTVFNTSSFSGTMQSYAAITSLFVWKYAGVGAVLIDTGLQRIPSEISQAAEIDGAGAKKIYTHIHIPILGKDLGLLILFLLMFAFRIYKESYLLFGEYPCDAMYLVQHYMNNHFLKMNFQNVSAGATSFAFLMFFIYGIAYWLMQKSRRNTL